MNIVATYRLQLHAGFPFNDATAIVPFLKELGISHVYCSPYLQARSGSTHGYDIVDHGKINQELGGRDGLERLVSALGHQQMGHILDIVPNHMAISAAENSWWWDVLENGPASYYASFFDMDWNPPEAVLRYRDKILLPVLGDHYGRVLKQGQFRLGRDGTRFHVSYFDKVYPLAPKSLQIVLRRAAKSGDHAELRLIAQACRSLPDAAVADDRSRRLRHDEKTRIMHRLGVQLAENLRVASAIDRSLIELNEDFDALDELLACQNYRLAYWRAAEHDLGYRRFFDIGDLAGLRMEEEEVFQKTHALVCELVGAGKIDGLRIDHPDGLRDPQAYFRRLRRACPKAWITAEKILEYGEAPRLEGGVAGTTGYDFLALVNQLYVCGASEGALTDIYHEFTGRTEKYADLVYRKKVQVLHDVLDSDVNRLTALLVGICEESRDHRDYTRVELHDAIVQFVAAFPVYRTYVRYEDEVSSVDRGYIEETVQHAQARNPDADPELFRFLGNLMLLREPGLRARIFVERLQQFTGSAMAKGVEDTTFYTYHRLVSLNEVGGDPGRLSTSLKDFHAAQQVRQDKWPESMLSTSTHDTKRSEDVRMRIHVLSEIPDDWRQAVNHWASLNATCKQDALPDRNTEYLLYQTLVGAWPICAERLGSYMLKACREAKEETSWIHPDEKFEEGLATFTTRILEHRPFLESVKHFVAAIAPTGRMYSLAQTLIKLTSPGIPDIYRGTELWDLSLVDPDNRRPVDYDLRQKVLHELDAMQTSQILQDTEIGLAKLFLIKKALAVRHQFPQAFAATSTYSPLLAKGPKREHVVAYVRGDSVCVVCPRLVVGIDWDGTDLALPGGIWEDVLTGNEQAGNVPMHSLWRDFPVALLVKKG